MSHSIIAVGVDGSESSRRALRCAVDEARLRGSSIAAVTTWPPRGATDFPSPEQADEMRRSAEELQRHVLDQVLREVEDPPIVSAEVVRGDPVEVLLRTSAHVDLLVVGTHGVSGLRHAALGSVSEACTRMSDCPCVVVPSPAPARLGTDVARR